MSIINIVTESDIVYGDSPSFLLVNCLPLAIDLFVNTINLEGDEDDYVVYVFCEEDRHKDYEWLLTVGQMVNQIIVNKDYESKCELVDYFMGWSKTSWTGQETGIRLKINPRKIHHPVDILVNNIDE